VAASGGLLQAGMSRRYFSAGSKKDESVTDDIFQSADYFTADADTPATASAVVEQSHELQQVPWMDMNDSLCTF